MKLACNYKAYLSMFLLQGDVEKGRVYSILAIFIGVPITLAALGVLVWYIIITVNNSDE